MKIFCFAFLLSKHTDNSVTSRADIVVIDDTDNEDEARGRALHDVLIANDGFAVHSYKTRILTVNSTDELSS